VLTLQNIAKKFCNGNIAEKSGTMAFSGQDSLRCKILVNNKCLQVKNFQYLGCEISLESGKHIQQKLVKFVQILGIRNNISKPTLKSRYFRE
jgi:hypothetical protein